MERHGCPRLSLLRQTLCSTAPALCSSAEIIAGRGAFDKSRASRQNESQDIKAKCAVTESAVGCVAAARGEGGRGCGTVPGREGDKHTRPSGEIFLEEVNRRTQEAGARRWA